MFCTYYRSPWTGNRCFWRLVFVERSVGLFVGWSERSWVGIAFVVVCAGGGFGLGLRPVLIRGGAFLTLDFLVEYRCFALVASFGASLLRWANHSYSPKQTFLSSTYYSPSDSTTQASFIKAPLSTALSSYRAFRNCRCNRGTLHAPSTLLIVPLCDN